MSTRIAPTTGPWGEAADAFRYMLASADPLPEIDFSVSIKSRFLAPPLQPLATKFMRQSKTIFGAFLVGGVLGAMAFASAVHVGRKLAWFAFLLQMPASFSLILGLRYWMVRRLVRTFDFWFFFAMTTSACTLVAMQLTDARALAIVCTWTGLIPNMLIDAHLRNAKQTAMGNVLGMSACVVLYAVMKRGGVDGANNFALFQQRELVVRCDEFISNGIATMIALLVRNGVRLRQAFTRRPGSEEVLCVSYTCALCVVHCSDVEHPRSPARNERRSTLSGLDPVQVLTLHEAFRVSIDARRVFWRQALTWADGRPAALYCLFGWISLAFQNVVSAVLYVRTIPTSTLVLTSSLSLLSTVIFVAPAVASFQRELLLRLVSSFDFLYISLQVAIIHLTACDFCGWNLPKCLVVATSWLWVEWALCVDAVSPIVKKTIFVHTRFQAVVLTLRMLNSFMLVYTMIMLKTLDEPYDRVVHFGGTDWSVRVLALFLNSFAVVVAFGTRLLYRAWTLAGDKLLVVEGQVVYQNYVANRKKRGIPWNGPLPPTKG